MATTIDRPTAKIYRFPVKAAVSGRDGLRDAAQAIVSVASGSAWYHEEAMRAEKPDRP